MPAYSCAGARPQARSAASNGLCALVPDAAALLRDAIVAAIGATTAAALATHGLRADAVAASPDPTAMARALAAVYPPR